MFQSSSLGLKSILKKGDVFILDRGFRDIVSALESEGYKVLMPALKGKRNQLTVEESNASRLVTKVRWVVEAVQGIIGQKWKLLHHQLHNSMLHNAQLYCQIACFLYNLFGKRLNSDKSDAAKIIARIEATKNLKNTLLMKLKKKIGTEKLCLFKNSLQIKKQIFLNYLLKI